MRHAVQKIKAFDFDICLSFAEEDRTYVEEVARLLKHKGVRVFYDKFEITDLWGKNLYTHLDDIYQNAARYCVVFASNHYAKKRWTTHELKSAQARAIRENYEYILPARFDNTKIPGLPDTVTYLNLRELSPKELVLLIVQKVGKTDRENFFPANPDYLFKELKIKSHSKKVAVYRVALEFLDILKRLTYDERELLLTVFLFGCPVELPKNIHIDFKTVVNNMDLSESRILRILSGLSGFGLDCRLIKFNDRESHEHVHIDVKWRPNSETENALDIVHKIVKGATNGYCKGHAMAALRRNDYSQLSSETLNQDIHD